MYKYLFFLLSIATSSVAQPLRQGEWRSYTAMTSVNGLATTPDSTGVWVSTLGGAFHIDLTNPKQEALKALRTLDGLSTNELSCVTTDPEGNIYFGGMGGSIDIYSPSTGNIRSIKDIVLSTLVTKKTINHLQVIGDRLYIAANYGISIYDRTRNAFGETVTRFSSLAPQDTAFAVLEVSGKIYVATSTAVAVADRNSPQLSAPFAWQLIRAPENVTLRTLTVFNGKIVTAGFGGAFIVTADSLERLPLPDTVLVFNAAARNQKLYFLDGVDNGRLISTNDLTAFDYSAIEGASTQDPVTAFCITGDESFAFGKRRNGVTLKKQAEVTQFIFPEGPISNEMLDIYFSRAVGKLFIAHGDLGIATFEPATSHWLHYTTSGPSATLPGNKYHKVYYDSLRSIFWASTFGGGILKCSFDGDALSYVRLDGDAGLPSTDANGNPDFVVVGQSTLDSKGDLIVSVWAQNGNGLARTSDGLTFTSTRLAPSGDIYRPWMVVAEDLEGYYFLGTAPVTVPAPFGVCYVTPEGNSGALEGGAGGILATPSISALVVDQDNNLWCGTSDGIEIVSHFKSSRTGVLEFRSRKLPFLDQQIVQTIAVDGVGNKWVGTENGVFVVSPDGADSLAHYTTSNSPLLDNSIVSISIDGGTGEVYIGTPKGISRTSSIYKEGNPDYSKLYVYPNPIIRSRDERPVVTIAGLVNGSTVKIYTVSGRLLKTIDATSLGSTVTWDGRDENGNELSSGVYVVGATSQFATESGQAKFVLVRK